jgi:uncharacterized protein YbaP (TraB family)
MLAGRFSFALCALFCSLLACARPDAAPIKSTVVDARAAPSGLFLYRVEREKHVSYLLGTIHLGFGFDEVLTPKAQSAFAAARVVITETDLTDDPASRLVQAALLPAGQTLNQMLDEPTWNALLKRLDGQVPTPVLAQMKPWLPAVLLGIAELKEAFDKARPGKSERMMDVELMDRAEKEGKTLRHLETVDEQIAVFENISIEEQVSELRHALEEDSRAQARALVLAFQSGDETLLREALFDDQQMKNAPGFYRAVLFARNARWLPVIEGALAQGDAFIAVGAAHLLGAEGLLETLRVRDYQIARVY